MTLQAIKGRLWFPYHFLDDAAPAFSTTLLLDAANETAGFIFKAPKAGNIDRVIYSLGAVAVTAGPLSFDARLETVDAATGLPSGTLLGTNSNGTDSIADTDDNDQREITLTTAVTVTKGQDIAFVLKAPSSGTFSVVLRSFGGGLSTQFPYAHLNGARSTRTPTIGLRYDDGTYIAPVMCFPMEALSSSNIGSGSTPDEVGNKFQLPFKCKVDSASIWMDPAASTDFTVRIYDGSDNVLLEMVYDSDIHNSQADGSVSFSLDDEITLDAATVYRYTVRPNTTAQEFHYFDVETAAYMDMHDGGQNIHATQRTDDGAWTDTTTRRYFISLGISALDDGASVGGGGLLTHPGMSGGLSA